MDKNSICYESCIKLCGIHIISPLMTHTKRQEMKEYREKAIVLEHKLKGKRISMDSGVMTASTEMQKIDSLESPIKHSKELKVDEKQSIISDILNNIHPEEINTDEHYTNKNETLNFDQTVVKNECIKSKDISVKEGIFVNETYQDNSKINDLTSSENDVSVNTDTPRIRSNSYTVLRPSPSMVSYLNSQIQQNLMKCKYLKKYTSIECKSEPPRICKEIRNDANKLAKSYSLCSVSKVVDSKVFSQNLYKIKKNCTSLDHLKNDVETQEDSVNTELMHAINLSDDESIVASAVTVLNGNELENNSSTDSLSRKCYKHSDDDFSLSSSIQYRTSEELRSEAEQLRKAKLEIDKRHEEELSNLIKKQREELQQLALRIFMNSQTSSSISLNQSKYSENDQESYNNPSITLTETTLTNDKSLLSNTSSIISNCSNSRSSRACSSPRQNPQTCSPSLIQNIKFYHRIHSNTNAKRSTKPPLEVENSAATVINAAVRGYLTRRLLKTEKAQMLKKTILDSLKTALIMHLELKKQKPTESDLELHQRIINQLTVACYDLNDLILGSVHERMSIIRNDRNCIKARKQRRKSTPLINHKTTPTYKQPKKSSSGYSLSKLNSGHLLEKKPSKENNKHSKSLIITSR